MKVIFDLDGTLADGSHREHFITERSPKDWDSYFKACVDDKPIWPIVFTLSSFCATPGHNVEIWSGRIERLEDGTNIRDMTIEWLVFTAKLDPFSIINDENPRIRLRMRPAKDYTPDDQLKERWLKETEVRPDLVFDDRQRVVDMWRRHRIRCCQVAPGDF